MNAEPRPRHLIERAMEAFGGLPASAPPPVPAPAEAAGAAPAEAPGPAATEPAAAGPAAAGEPAAGAALAEAPAAEAPRAAPRPAPPPITFEALRHAGFVGHAHAGTRNRVTEELNLVQQQIQRSIRATEPSEGRITRMMLVTSAKPGEGKTFCSLNIAARMATGAPEQVILVDADGKKEGSLTNLLGQEAAPGLRWLAGDPTLRPDRLPVPTALGRLAFLPYGPAAPDTPGLPSGQMLAAAIGRLAAAMPGRILIVDAPPCLSTSEPAALAAIAGQVAMVVEAQSTQRDEVEAALDMVDSCPTLQLLLNRTRIVAANAFGAYGYYYTG